MAVEKCGDSAPVCSSTGITEAEKAAAAEAVEIHKAEAAFGIARVADALVNGGRPVFQVGLMPFFLVRGHDEK